MSSLHFPHYSPTWGESVIMTLGAIAITGGLLLSSLVAYWLFRPYRGFDVKRISVVEPVVFPSGLLRYKVDYCVADPLPVMVEISREIEKQEDGSLTFPLANLSFQVKERCEHRDRLVGLPAYLPTGMYHLHLITRMMENPLREVTQTFQSNEFEVQRNDVDEQQIRKEIMDAIRILQLDVRQLYHVRQPIPKDLPKFERK